MTRSTVVALLFSVPVWIVACTRAADAPPALVPPTAVDRQAAESMPTASATAATTAVAAAVEEDAVAILPTPTATIAENDADAVTWNPVEAPLQLKQVADGLTEPLFATDAGDSSGRLFFVEQPGRIRIQQDGTLLDAPFLDISDHVNDGASEQGLLGLAFAPDYPKSGQFYVNYTDVEGDTVVARYRLSADDPNAADPASETVVLAVGQPAGNHNGGMIAFGPDGHLYISLGDGGGSGDRYGNGQNPATLLGKLLRIDVSSGTGTSYAIPPDNPWIDVDWHGEDVRDEIWATGLRNPWRFSFDRKNGDLWIADVGQSKHEEVNHVPAAEGAPYNFGWPIMEGTHCFDADTCDSTGLWQPSAEYGREDGCSVTGGYVYRGRQFPALSGVYFFADYCTGKIWAMMPNSQGPARVEEVLDTELSISSFGEDEAGELYVTDLSSGTVSQLTLGQN